MPQWPQQPPGIDPTGRLFGVVSFPGAAGISAGWISELARSRADWWAARGAANALLPGLRKRLEAETVGFRLLVAGPESDVLAAAAVARAAGVIPAEMTLHATSDTTRRVYCVHCKVTSTVTAEVGEVAECAGCGRGLMVFAHLSRHSGAYLGFLADAEELPWT